MDPFTLEELGKLPRPLRACPECGGLVRRPAGLEDGVFAGGGELTAFACERCGRNVLALEFETPADYAAFEREARHRG